MAWVLVILMTALFGAPSLSQTPPDFPATLRPLLAEHCFRCHGPKIQKAGLDLSGTRTARDVRANPVRWRTVAAHVRSGFMPPTPAAQPTANQRRRLANGLETLLRGREHSGTVTMRRLNRIEYANTVGDLLGVRVDPRQLPADAATYGFDNIGDGLFVSALLVERYFEITKAVTDQALSLPSARDRLMPRRPSESTTAASAARANLGPLLRRAFRRQPTAPELEARVKIVKDAIAGGAGWDAAMGAAVESILLSPHFLFRVEPGGETRSGGRALTDHEIAVRLSYFLFSTSPDGALARAADDGKLSEPEELRTRALDMLRDDRSRALADNFASQWLRYREIRHKAVDGRRFMWIDDALRSAMYEESARTFDAIVREGRPVTELIDADTILVNARLASHYGIPGIKGPRFRRVPAGEGRRRGGVLGMASVLTVTSDPLRTNPVVRGKWVLESLLGTPPAPPPADAGTLPDDDKQKDGLTLRQRLELHREEPRCASCHAVMDPYGFALEHYDGVGRWRDKVHGAPVDASSSLPDGSRISGPAGLKDVLLARKDAFVRTMAERLLVYAVGRPVGPEDAPLVERMVQACARDGYRFAPLVAELVASTAFRYR